MEFNFKIQLLGYYNKENQCMNPEQKYVQEAETLVKLLSKSFDGLTSDMESSFSAALRGDAVFIFRNHYGDLFAYYPCKQLARITNVKYNSQDIIKVKRAYKNWFIPGKKFIIDKNAVNEVPFKTLSGKNYMIGICPDSIYLNRDDYYIKIGNSVYAIYWDETICMDDLKALILHKWIYLRESKMSDYCGDCNGWDYSGCDMDRCREDCDGCGGRRYKCNNSCFNKRHKIAITLCLRSLTIKKEIQEGLNILDKISKPFSTEADTLWKNSQPLFTSLKKNYQFIQNQFGDIDIMQKFLQKLENTATLQYMRHRKEPLIEIKVYKEEIISRYIIPLSSLRVEQSFNGILWFKQLNTTMSFNTYDYVSDTFVREEYHLDNKQKYSYLLDKKILAKFICITLELKENDQYECRIN